MLQTQSDVFKNKFLQHIDPIKIFPIKFSMYYRVLEKK